MTKPQSSVRLGTLLVESGHLTDQGLQEALAEQARTNLKLGEVLSYLSLVSEPVLLDCLAKQFGLTRISISTLDINVDYCRHIPEDVARLHHAAIYREEQGQPIVVISDPSDFSVIETFNTLLNKKPRYYCALRSEIDALLNKIYHNDEVQCRQPVSADEASRADTAPTQIDLTQILHDIFRSARDQGASDLHMEFQDRSTSYRLRIDGELFQQHLPKWVPAQPLINRLKNLANISLDDGRQAHEGMISIQLAGSGSPLDVRLSLYKNNAVMRITPRDKQVFALDELGMSDNTFDTFQHRLQHTQGVTLFSGPAGSGRTSSLYAALSHLNTPKLKLVTLEEQAEHHVKGIESLQLDPANISSSLNHALRRDPDVLMLSEVRNTAEVNVLLKSASSGVKTLSTVDAPNAIDACLRMLHLCDDAQLLAMRLDMVVSQRLLKRSCPHCATERELTESEKAILSKNHIFITSQVVESSGCSRCHHRGNLGRIGIFEMLTFSRDMRHALQQSDKMKFIKLAEEQLRGRSLLDHAVEHAEAKRINIREVINMINYPLE